MELQSSTIQPPHNGLDPPVPRDPLFPLLHFYSLGLHCPPPKPFPNLGPLSPHIPKATQRGEDYTIIFIPAILQKGNMTLL